MPKKKKQKNPKFSNTLRFIWIVAGILMIVAVVEVLLLVLKVKEYFP